jgi:hypothetical protein
MTTETAHYCATHPDVETELACGKCGRFICPRCMVQTPVGARCRECAQLRRPPMYTLAPASVARVVGTALGVGGAVGLAWGLLVPGLGFLGFFMLFLGMFAGYGMATVVDWAGGRKRGPVVQWSAVAGIVVAYLVRNLVLTGGLLIINDLWGLIFVGIAAAVAWNRLR